MDDWRWFLNRMDRMELLFSAFRFKGKIKWHRDAMKYRKR